MIIINLSLFLLLFAKLVCAMDQLLLLSGVITAALNNNYYVIGTVEEVDRIEFESCDIWFSELIMFRFQFLIALIFVLKGNASISKNETVLLGSGQMFDSIAPYYDVANTIMSLGQHHRWRR